MSRRLDGKPPQESISQLIDRLVRGDPPRAVFFRRVAALRADGWTFPEIALEIGVDRNIIEKRLYYARRLRRR